MAKELLEDGIELRPEVRRFAVLMEMKLQWNDYKGGWDDMANDQILDRLSEELDEFWVSIGKWIASRRTDDKLEIQGEAVDVANFLMMFLDNNKLL